MLVNVVNFLSEVEGWDLDRYKLLLLLVGIVSIVLVLVYVALQSRAEEE